MRGLQKRKCQYFVLFTRLVLCIVLIMSHRYDINTNILTFLSKLHFLPGLCTQIKFY